MRRGGRLFTGTRPGFRGGSTRDPDARVLPAGAITRINGLSGRPLTLRLTQPAFATEDAVWGVRTAAAHDRFFKEFMDILR